jgi:hypothetical protein
VEDLIKSSTWVKSQLKADSVVAGAGIGEVGWWVWIRSMVGGGELSGKARVTKIQNVRM